jgi:hypothetical protein
MVKSLATPSSGRENLTTSDVLITEILSGAQRESR